MSDKVNNGGDISSGFGDADFEPPVSDEKAQQMLHSRKVSETETTVVTSDGERKVVEHQRERTEVERDDT